MADATSGRAGEQSDSYAPNYFWELERVRCWSCSRWSVWIRIAFSV